MASEWVGVVGALGGAAIGGVVTVASLIVKGRQDETAEKRRGDREDQHRVEDREWSLRQQNTEKRQEIYSELLVTATALEASVRGLQIRSHSRSDDKPLGLAMKEERDNVKAAADKLALAQQTTRLAAINREVPTLAKELWEWAQETSKLETLSELDEAVEDGYRRVEVLATACRRDLGFT